MILRLALRSLATRPIRTLILACGFGLGIAIMAILLGVGEVILNQSRSPALSGGGDVVVSSGFGAVENARFIVSSVLGAADLKSRMQAASPSKRATIVRSIAPRANRPSSSSSAGEATAPRGSCHESSTSIGVDRGRPSARRSTRSRNGDSGVPSVIGTTKARSSAAASTFATARAWSALTPSARARASVEASSQPGRNRRTRRAPAARSRATFAGK